jgi:hypothetical protein
MASHNGDTVRELSKQEQSNALAKLRQDRAAHGFKVYIRDFLGQAPIKQAEWELNGPNLIVNPNASVATYKEVHQYIENKLGDRSWFQKALQSPPVAFNGAPVKLSDQRPYGIPIKVLGKNGANQAVDAVILIPDENGRVKLLTINRPDGTKAVPGGMNESSATETYTTELLEEVFSNDLFSVGSATAQLIDMKNSIGISNELTRLSQEDKAFNALRVLDLQIYDGIAPTLYIHKILALVRGSEQVGSVAQREHLCVQLKCHLYQYFLPEQYRVFKETVSSGRIVLECRVNQSDSRNTDYAWMETTPYVRVIDHRTFTDLQQQAGLTRLAGGDDAEDAQFCELQEFWTGKRPIFCDHGAIVLDAVATAIDQGKLTLSGALSAQLEIIAKQIQNKEKYASSSQQLRFLAAPLQNAAPLPNSNSSEFMRPQL